MGKLQELVPIVREALRKTALVANIFCLLHVTNAHLCSVAMVGLLVLYICALLCTVISVVLKLCISSLWVPVCSRRSIPVTSFWLKGTSRSGKVGSGDAVLIRSPEDPRKVIAKRVGVEGDVVSYVVDPNKSDEQKTLVPKGHVWMEGDNMHNSKDSRKFGAVPCALVESRIFVVVWPPEDFRLIRNKVL